MSEEDEVKEVVPYVDVESNLQDANQPFNYLSFCTDSFKDDLLRSQYVKQDIYDLKNKAKQVLDGILDEPTTDKNRSVKADVAKWAMENSMIKTEMPKLSMIISRSEKERGHRGDTAQIDEVRVTKEELSLFLRDAMATEKEIQEEKLKRLKAGSEHEAKV